MKNNNFINLGGFKKIPLAMGLAIVMLFSFVSMTFADNVYAEKTVLDIYSQNKTVAEILDEIEQKSEFTFFYNNKQVDVNRSVSVEIKSENIFKILDEVFQGTDVVYKVLDKHIILSDKQIDAAVAVAQQTGIIKGKVVDSNGEPIIGANVIVVGTTVGGITDLDGNFSIEAAKGAVLKVSFIGYIEQQVTVGNQTNLQITLVEDSKALDEVVVIGYGTARKSSLTGALSQVSSESFSEQNVTRVDEALQGRAPGIQVSNTVGAPGGDVRIRIRGANSVLGDNSPLFVIDGFVGADFNLLNPNDIKSMEILKDASSTAIYGSRGANGVILITTKSGSKDSKVNVTYRGSVSVSNIIKEYDLMNAGDFATLVNEHDAAKGITNLKFTEQEIEEFYRTGGFDYMDAILRTAVSHQHQISVGGGTEKTQYRISGNFLDQQGIVENTGYKRYTMRASVNTKVNDKFSFRFNTNAAYSDSQNNQARTGAGNPIVQAMAWAPTTNPYTEDGGFLSSDPTGSIKGNPLSMIYDAENLRKRTTLNIMGGARYEIIDGLNIDFQAAADLAFYDNKTWSGNYASNNQPSASKTSNRAHTIQTTTQLSYEKTFADIHNINAVVAVETQKYGWESLSGSASNLKFADLKYDNLAQAGSTSLSSDYSMWALLSYLGRINYTLMDKYLFSVSVRRDGSSKFAEGNKFSTFPAGAVAWNAGNEEFIKDLNIFSKLKIRFSWGLTGSQAISPYATQSAYNTGIYYAFDTGDRTNGIQLSNPGNAALKWETTEQKDFGIEMGFLDGRLNFEFDYFVKDTRDLLLNRSVAYYMGGGSMTDNVGNIQNKGIELSLTADVIRTKDWNWKSTLNFATVKNKVTSLGDEFQIFDKTDLTGLNGQPAFVYQVGESLGTFWGLKYLGPWQKDEAAEAAKYGCVPGDAHYEDLDGNFSIDGSDYQIIGCGMPKHTLGWNNTVTYKNFTLNAFFQGVFGVEKMNFTRCLHTMGDRDARYATLSDAKDRYIPGVQENAWLPAWSNSSKWEAQSTLFMEDASYLRLKNISLSYDFKVKKLADFKVSLSATNLFTITGYKGVDPESSNVGGSGSDIMQGIDYGAYPNSRTYTLGLEITF